MSLRTLSVTRNSFRVVCRAIVQSMVVIVVAAPVWAQSNQPSGRSLNDWLVRMHEASRQRAYTGTLVVSSGAVMSTSRIWHVCDGTQQMERVDTLTGSPRTTIRKNSDVITFDPESRVAWREKRESLGLFPELLRAPTNSIQQFYDVADRGMDRVAGHAVDALEILPKDGLRFGYRIWAEKKTGLVVKLQTLDNGVVLEQVAFTELQLDAPVRMEKLSRLMSDTKGYEIRQPNLRKTTAEAEGWRLREAVPGFASMSCHVRDAARDRASSSGLMQWVFSDGLASVSLFIEPFEASSHRNETQSVDGATHALTRRVGDHWLTAMGEVPINTLRRFALALERIR